jgi:hypothetical protein
MTNEARTKVLERWPDAVAITWCQTHVYIARRGKPWDDPKSLLGGGPTESEAWESAARGLVAGSKGIGIETDDGDKAMNGEGSDD